MDGWMDVWMDGWMDVCLYVCIIIIFLHTFAAKLPIFIGFTNPRCRAAFGPGVPDGLMMNSGAPVDLEAWDIRLRIGAGDSALITIYIYRSSIPLSYIVLYSV